jgi:hypothetical protein
MPPAVPFARNDGIDIFLRIFIEFAMKVFFIVTGV